MIIFQISFYKIHIRWGYFKMGKCAVITGASRGIGAGIAEKLASEHWGIKDGYVDPENGLRYRVVCKRKIDERWYEISLYRFVYNSYYEHLEIATVNIETKEIKVTPYPDGKG